MHLRPVEIRDEEQIRRAVVPETGVDAPDVERRVRHCGVDEEWLDRLGDDAVEVDRDAFDSRHVARRRWILEGHRAWRGASMNF